MNLQDKTFTYTVNSDGTVNYTATCDGKQQTLAGHDLSSKEALEADLAQYTEAYVAGLAQVQPTIGSDIVVGDQTTGV